MLVDIVGVADRFVVWCGGKKKETMKHEFVVVVVVVVEYLYREDETCALACARLARQRKVLFIVLK